MSTGNCNDCGNGDDDSGNGPDPSEVGYDQCGNEVRSTYCDLNIENNLWVEGVVDLSANPQKRGICMLDTMSREQFLYVIQHNPFARRDLPKVTSSPELLEALARVPLLSTKNASDTEQSIASRRPGSLPFNNVFRGQPPYKKQGPDK